MGSCDKNVLHARDAILVLVFRTGHFHEINAGRQIIGRFAVDFFQETFRLCASIPVLIRKSAYRSCLGDRGRSEIGGGFESLVRLFEIVAAPIESAQSRIGFARFRVQIKGGFEFAFRARLVVLSQIKRSQCQMITGAVLIFFPKALDEFSGVLNIVGFSRSIDKQQKCLFVPRLFLQDLQSGVARLRIRHRSKERSRQA